MDDGRWTTMDDDDDDGDGDEDDLNLDFHGPHDAYNPRRIWLQSHDSLRHQAAAIAAKQQQQQQQPSSSGHKIFEMTFRHRVENETSAAN
ncbi:hypothetical protein AWZ03_008949 [Drosophila navojoa]|uniref:Uncharacterized protein n=1 Tax=Drosophila navojoa TaxID=7232 RepID=A0A484B7G2_DRONA|nr:hypothetical protein AWZ03_008949 [Drosophila navojoa]